MTRNVLVAALSAAMILPAVVQAEPGDASFEGSLSAGQKGFLDGLRSSLDKRLGIPTPEEKAARKAAMDQFHAAFDVLLNGWANAPMQASNLVKSVQSDPSPSAPTVTVTADLVAGGRSYKATMVYQGTAEKGLYSKLELVGSGQERLLITWSPQWPTVTYRDASGATISRTFEFETPDFNAWYVVERVFATLGGPPGDYPVLPKVYLL